MRNDRVRPGGDLGRHFGDRGIGDCENHHIDPRCGSFEAFAVPKAGLHMYDATVYERAGQRSSGPAGTDNSDPKYSHACEATGAATDRFLESLAVSTGSAEPTFTESFR